MSEHYKKEDGSDTIDKWAERLDIETFREVIWCLMEKYKDRLTKKDAAHLEVAKIADYAKRWADHERDLVSVQVEEPKLPPMSKKHKEYLDAIGQPPKDIGD